MNFIMIISKIDMAINQDYYLRMLIVTCMILTLRKFLLILARIKKCLIKLIFLLNQIIMLIEKH